MQGPAGLLVLLALVLGVAIGYAVNYLLNRAAGQNVRKEANEIIVRVKKESEELLRESRLKAKEEAQALKESIENELKDRRSEIQRLEDRLINREESLERRIAELDEAKVELGKQQESITQAERELDELKDREREEIERVSRMTTEEAREEILARTAEEAKYEALRIVKAEEDRAKEEADRKSRYIISMAIQRCATDHTAETTVSVVNLPSDDMKGRIIGREGRNIRAFENITGINLIIDDTPEAVILSSFDPIRREVSRRTLERLISDGRIHPARIEEMYHKSVEELEEEFREVGEEAIFETGLSGIHHELIRALGRLRFRTSFGQNVLSHSLEVAHLSGLMAAELGIDVKTAKRAGLLHDLGKAIDHEVEGPHAIIGGELAKRFKEPGVIVNAIESHHGETAPTSVEAVLIQAADAISASRPGARRETLESYIKRLESLEDIVRSYKGVEKCYAIQAGREVRAIVKPEKISDDDADLLAREMAKRIEDELDYPGQIKVTVIREHRAIEYAK